VNRLIYNTSRLVHVLPEAELDFLIALILNLIFVALAALLLWPLGKPMMALRLAQGYGIFWVVTALTGAALYRVQKFFRVDTDTHYDALVISNLSHAALLLAGWSAFAALTVRVFVSGTPGWVAVTLWLIGLLSSHVAFIVLSSFYKGTVYKVVNVILGLAAFIVFAVWPASGRAIYGWFFDLF
jgi:hypothetical protein